ncbi:MAG: hypothetical protein KF799_11895 [Bdellovibrionales bacterium]|nr:hypothetical protein [Bdellovibrionales bacterium]
MKTLLLALSIFSAAAFAQSGGQGKAQNLLVDVGFAQGGFKFGGAYDYIYNGSQGIGGQFHYYTKKEPATGTAGKTGFMIAGAHTSYHFYKGDWDFSLAPSFNIVNIDNVGTNAEDKTGFGPGLSIGLTQAINDRVAIGFALNNYWVWFGEEIRGHQIDDLNFRVKVGF